MIKRLEKKEALKLENSIKFAVQMAKTSNGMIERITQAEIRYYKAMEVIRRKVASSAYLTVDTQSHVKRYEKQIDLFG